MKGLDLFEELTELEESTVKGGVTFFNSPFGNFQLTGDPTSPFGAYFSYPAALLFRTTNPATNGIWNLGGGYSFRFAVARGSDQPTNYLLSGLPNANLPVGLPGTHGLAGANGLAVAPFIPA